MVLHGYKNSTDFVSALIELGYKYAAIRKHRVILNNEPNIIIFIWRVGREMSDDHVHWYGYRLSSAGMTLAVIGINLLG